ncbi:unnamed protein product [Mytilus edulis]|uniref:Uncharacterized protein n=1 Tax=Mytilus edulis TaxID=6550 RepID=A0A8S3UHF0_MYTED|nr:unnamed protein product [Mytilus edulis]
MFNSIKAIDGQWSSWTTTSCSMTCGNGMTYRNRTCNNPSPSDGGKICQGVDNESSVCNLGDCRVDGHWGLWSSVRCSITCGNGIGRRTRRCDNPAPSGGGKGCVGCNKKRKYVPWENVKLRMEESKKIKRSVQSQINDEYHEVKKNRINFMFHFRL